MVNQLLDFMMSLLNGSFASSQDFLDMDDYNDSGYAEEA